MTVTCDRCNTSLHGNDSMTHNGKTLCEDCYIDALSPSKACDPWAVHLAKSFTKDGSSGAALSDHQSQILTVLTETGGVEPHILVKKTGMKPSDLERDLATLRHMEKIRAELREGVKYIRLW